MRSVHIAPLRCIVCPYILRQSILLAIELHDAIGKFLSNLGKITPKRKHNTSFIISCNIHKAFDLLWSQNDSGNK